MKKQLLNKKSKINLVDNCKVCDKTTKILFIGMEILLFIAIIVFYVFVFRDHPGSMACWIIPSASYVKPYSIILSVFSFVPVNIYFIISRKTIRIRNPVAISRLINSSANILVFMIYLGVGSGCTIYIHLHLYLFIQLLAMIIPYNLLLFFNKKNRKLLRS